VLSRGSDHVQPEQSVTFNRNERSSSPEYATINDGVRDRDGRVLVRRNAPYAVRLLRRAVESGDENAAGSLGYAYDVGHGVRRDKALALEWYRRAVRHGDCGAASNIATAYRDQGDLRLAHRWVLRAMVLGDGDDAVTAGYNYLYGIGVRRNRAMARRLFAHALEMEFDRFPNCGLRFCKRAASRNATRQIRNVRRIVIAGGFDDDCILRSNCSGDCTVRRTGLSRSRYDRAQARAADRVTFRARNATARWRSTPELTKSVG
jgi:hypothetical protein